MKRWTPPDGLKLVIGKTALLLLLLISFVSLNARAENQSFVFDLAGEEKTIGDIKPSFIVYKEKEMPDVSVEYVMKRYVKLFETSTSPEVKIDALNRINNLSAKYGISSQKLTIDEVIQSQVLLESYDNIVDSGVFYERMDELLYQTAKATSFTGNQEDAIKRLKLLIGLYPNSPLIDESMFRKGEALFSIGEYAKAEAEYKKLIAFATDKNFNTRAKFKLGWSVFRQDRFDEATKHAFDVLNAYPVLKHQRSFSQLEEDDQDLVEDTLRLLSIQFSKQNGADSLIAAQQRLKNEDYAYLLHDGLFRFYLKQDRFEEAAVVAAQYAGAYNTRFDAYYMALQAIEAYRKGEFDIQTWNSKEDFVENFGVISHYWAQLNSEQQGEIKPHLAKYGQELAHLYFIRMQAQRGKDQALHQSHGQRSADFYLQLTRLTPEQPDNGEHVYLAAEALRDIGQYLDAISLYERSAYGGIDHDKSNNAAYAAILTFDEFERAGRVLEADQIERKHDNILRYADKFPEDKETPQLLSYLANTLFDDEAYDQAVEQADRVLAIAKPNSEIYYSSLLVAAHSRFKQGRYLTAEKHYAEAVAHKLSKEERGELKERLALSIYRQAEQNGDLLASAQTYLRVVDTTPGSAIVPQALFDASAQFLAASAWSDAIASLSHLQASFPKHELSEEATDKLIYAYQESEDWVSAADKLLEKSNATADQNLAAQSVFQAAEYYQKSDLELQALDSYESFTKRFPAQFDLNMEAYDRITQYYLKFDKAKHASWANKLVSYEKDNVANRNARSASLAASTAFLLAQPKIDRFKSLALTTPLKKSLANKRKLLDSAVASMQAIADYNIQEWQSAATFEIAGMYRQLANALMDSERPSSLTELQLEQYDILLEEQAYPFEEKALEVYEVNTAKVPEGLYDEWIAKSYSVLADMNPTRYAREWKEGSYAEQAF